MKINQFIINGYFISASMHLIIVVGALLIGLPKKEISGKTIFVDFIEFEKKVIQEKGEKEEIPGYRISSFDDTYTLDEVEVLSDTLVIENNNKIKSLFLSNNSKLFSRTLNSIILRERIRKADSIKHFALNKEPPPSQAFNFKSFNMNSGKNYRSMDNFKKESFPGGGFGIPIIPVLKLIGIL